MWVKPIYFGLHFAYAIGKTWSIFPLIFSYRSFLAIGDGFEDLVFMRDDGEEHFRSWQNPDWLLSSE